MVSKTRESLVLITLALGLLSCIPKNEAPTPFPNLLFYQGPYHFSFGGKRKAFITSVPGENGERLAIASIHDDFYSCRGFLLYICSLENNPADNQLYRYDYAASESTFICSISSRREPQFFALDNDYSPGFFVDKADKEAYAFLGERNEIVTFDGEDTPYYACEWGYATSLRNQWNNYEFDHNTKKEENNIFRFYDGTTVPIKNGGRTISAGENKVLFLISSADNRLAQFDKKNGENRGF